MASRWVLGIGSPALLLLACETGAGGGGPMVIHPQPQPTDNISFLAPCNESACGPAPETVASPRCKREDAVCAWSDDTAVSYRQCPDADCGPTPTGQVCPVGTSFVSVACGSENDATCAWRTICAPPPSTTPCERTDGCGGKPELGVICKDGSTGDLACMQFDGLCKWQRTCE